jgi:predicted lipase
LGNLDFESTRYRPVPDFGDVHMGWMGLYETMRANLADNLPAACQGCDQLIVTGHSLGAALAVLAAPDIAKNTPAVPEPKLTTFGGPRPGLHDFVLPFNLLIDTCFRMVNLFDIVPHVPLALPGLPYEHVGVQIALDSGGSISPGYRHTLDAYEAGLAKLVTAQPAWAA